MTKTVDTLRWGYAFLSANGPSTLEERLELVDIATKMYLKNEEEKIVNGETYDGKLKQSSGYQFVAPGFSGIKYEGFIENKRGKTKLSFLISEKVRSELN